MHILFKKSLFLAGTLVSNRTPDFSAIRPAIPEIRNTGASARVHMQMHTAHDLRDMMHRYLIPNHTPNLVTHDPSDL